MYEIVISIDSEAVSYKTDFADNETVFWLETVKNIVIKKMAEEASYYNN